MTDTKNLIILGPQGSGKGTQASLLRDKFGLVSISVGQTLRELAQEDSALARRVKATIDSGTLVDPQTIAEVMKNKLATISADKGIVVDSLVRTKEQYRLMKEYWPTLNRGDYTVIYIELPDDEAVRRLSARRVCAKCGENYIAGTTDKCTKCGGELIQRDDDKPEAIKKRLEWSRRETMPMVGDMEKDGKVIRIDGSPSVEEVQKEILKKLE